MSRYWQTLFLALLSTLAQAHTSPAGQTLCPIVLGPGLLVYLDPLKRQRFLEAWRSRVQSGR